MDGGSPRFGITSACLAYLPYLTSVLSQCMLCIALFFQQVLVGFPFYKSCIKGLVHYSIGMDMLIAVATTVAYLYSVAALIVNIATGWDYALFFDSGPLLLLFITLGKLLEHIAKVHFHVAHVHIHVHVYVCVYTIPIHANYE